VSYLPGWVALLVGMALLVTGCSRPLATATATANAAAHSLKATQEALAERYREDQLAAAKRVQGDRSDPSVKAEQRDRVRQVRARYRPLWDAYAIAYEAWLEAVTAIEIAEQIDGADSGLEMVGVIEAVRQLVRSQRRLVSMFQEVSDGSQ